MAEIEVLFDARGTNKLIARLDALPQELLARLEPAIERLTQQMLAEVLAREPERTGALKAATRSFVDKRNNLIRGRVRILGEPGGPRHNVKAAALEYGAHGRAAVSAHEMSLDHVFATEIAPEDVTVGAYQRDVNIGAERFLRDALADIRAEFEIEIDRAIAEVARTFS